MGCRPILVPRNTKFAVFLTLALSLVVAVPPVYGLDPTKPLREYQYQVWEEAEGLPHYSINSILQGSQGYLWLATYYGVVRFDGKRFMVYDRTNTPALTGNQIWSLARDTQDTLWIGSAQGLLYYRDRQFRKFPLPKPAEPSIRALRAYPNGDVLIGTSAGGFVLRDGQAKPIGPRNVVVRSILQTRQGDIWLGTQTGLILCHNSDCKTFGEKDGLPESRVLSLIEDRSGTLWVGTAGGLALFRGGKLVPPGIDPILREETVWTMLEGRDGEIWVGMLGAGLVRIYNGKMDHFQNPRRASSQAITALHEDREGTLWIGASGAGLGRLQAVPFHTFTREDGLGGNLAQSAMAARDGTLWASFNGGGISHLTAEGAVIRNFKRENGLPTNDVWSLHEDRKGNIWAGGYNGTLAQLNGSRVRVFSQKDGIPNSPVLAVSVDSEDDVWFSTMNAGLGVIRQGKVRIYTTADGLPSNHIRTFYQDRSGRRWVGTEKGLSLFQDGKFTNFSRHDGLSGDFVFCIHESDDGTFWIGTFDGGLTRFQNGKWVRFGPESGFPALSVFQVLEDRHGSLWISSSTGIFRLKRSDLDDYADGKLKRIHAVSYGITEGLNSRECNGGQPAGTIMADGRLWFPTVKGLASVQPDNLVSNTLMPPVVVEEIRVNGKALDFQDRATLPAGSRNLEIDYTALSLVSPDKVPFRYRLIPYDKDWVEAGNRRSAFYSMVPAGQLHVPGDRRQQRRPVERDRSDPGHHHATVLLPDSLVCDRQSAGGGRTGAGRPQAANQAPDPGPTSSWKSG